MFIFNPFKPRPKPKRLQTSRPIFQFSSSFIDDDNDSKFQNAHQLPLFHQRPLPHHAHSSSSSSTFTKKPESSSAIRHPRPHARIHLILHVLSMLFTLTSLTLFITAIPIWNANFRHTKSPIPTDYTDGLVLAPLFISLLSSTYLLLTEHTRLADNLHFRFRFLFRMRLDRTSSPGSPSPSPSSSPRKPLVPKRLLLLSLTILLTLFPTLTLSATNSLALSFRAPIHNSAGLIPCNLTNMLTKQCQPILFRIGELQVGAIVMGALAWCVWAVVLGVAMWEWARERRERERRRRERRRMRRKERDVRKRQPESERQRNREVAKGRGYVGLDEDKAAKVAAGDDGVGVGKGWLEDRPHNVRTGQHAYGPHNLTRSDKTKDEPVGVAIRKPPPVISPAARLTSLKVKPKETIQMWLNERHT